MRGLRRKNRRRIRWNTLRIFCAENDADACSSFAAAEWHDSDRLLGSEAWEEGRQLHRQPHVPADAEATGHGDHRAADLTVQHTETILARHGQRDIRIRMSALRHLAGPLPDPNEILPPVGSMQIELVHHIQSFSCLRVQFVGERGKKGSYRFRLCVSHAMAPRQANVPRRGGRSRLVP